MPGGDEPHPPRAVLAGHRRERLAGRVRALRPPGAGLPGGARARLGLARQRHGRRDRRPNRRRPGQALLRPLVRLHVVVERHAAARAARAAARPLRIVDPRPGAPVHPPRHGRRHGGRDGRDQPRRLPRRELRAQARRRVPAGHRAVRQLRPGRLECLGRARRVGLLQQPLRLPRAHGRRPPRVAALPPERPAGLRPGDVGGHDRRARVLQAPRRSARRQGDPPRAGPVGPRRAPRLAVLASPDRPPSPEVLLMSESTHLIGLLLGTEEDWPRAFETLLERVGPVKDASGTTHRITSERITIEPFDLRDKPRYDLVVDRLAWWYFVPREWLKKVALMDDVYLLNSPFTFQAMEKHAAYCAMIRLGIKVPPTVLVPHKNPPENTRFEYTAAKYNRSFDLAAIAESIGYPLFMKPYDGGQWVGVTRIKDAGALQQAYDESGERLMHLQASVEGFDKFARSLSIGAETMVMDFRPDQPMHNRYAVSHDFLTPETGEEILTISRLINAFFRWEFNSCETLVRGAEAYPIDYANASPDVALTSLHYYFPWAMAALLKWTIFCTVTGRDSRVVDMDTRRYFAIGDREDLSYREKLAEYRRLADEYFQVDEYTEFCATALGHFDELVLDWVASPEFDALLIETVKSTYPEHEQEEFAAHFRGLLGLWVYERGRTPQTA